MSNMINFNSSDNIITDFKYGSENVERTRQDLIRLRDNDPDFTKLVWTFRRVGDEEGKAVAEMLNSNKTLHIINIIP